MSRAGIIVGVSDHGGWAVLVTADGNGTLLDRRRVEVVAEWLPKIPHHSADESGVSKPRAGRRPSLIWLHAARDVVLDLHVEIDLDVPDSFGIPIGTMKETTPAHDGAY